MTEYVAIGPIGLTEYSRQLDVIVRDDILRRIRIHVKGRQRVIPARSARRCRRGRFPFDCRGSKGS